MTKRLLEHLKSDSNLTSRLSAPLRTTHIQPSGSVFSANKLPGSGVITAAELLTEGNDWCTGWQFTDVLQKSTE